MGLTDSDVLSDVRNALSVTTLAIQESFPNSIVLPTLGNHDSAPPNQFQTADPVFSTAWQLWHHWMRPSTEQDTFLRGGYYAREVGQLTYLVLNTNLYYRFNAASFNDSADPALQFAYARKVLSSAKKQKRGVVVVAHIPPGCK